MTSNKHENFPLCDDDNYAIDIAKKTVRRFLADPKMTPQQIIGLGNALYALERLPKVTHGVSVEFGIVYRAGSEDFNEMLYINFKISEDIFEISTGGSVYEKNIGSNSFSECKFTIDIDGYREDDCDLQYLEDNITEYLKFGGKINVHDESKIEYELERYP